MTHFAFRSQERINPIIQRLQTIDMFEGSLIHFEPPAGRNEIGNPLGVQKWGGPQKWCCSPANLVVWIGSLVVTGLLPICISRIGLQIPKPPIQATNSGLPDERYPPKRKTGVDGIIRLAPPGALCRAPVGVDDRWAHDISPHTLHGCRWQVVYSSKYRASSIPTGEGLCPSTVSPHNQTHRKIVQTCM